MVREGNEQENGAALQNRVQRTHSNGQAVNIPQTSDGSAQEELHYYRSFLDQLLSLVCNEDQESVTQMVSIIRSGASHQEILAAISEIKGGHPGQEGN